MSVCALAVALAVGVGPAFAATSFGSYGQGAEQLSNFPVGVAVDATGDVYVGDGGNNRVDKFDGSGNWLLAWGSGVANGAREMQTCTTECQMGQQTSSREAFEIDTGVAVDDDPLSSSYGDVYVVNQGHKEVEKFDPSGKFILMFGGHVNETTGEDVCRAGEACKLYGTIGAADGEFEYWPSFSSFIAVGPGGAVYVGDKARVEVFEASGAWKENISLAGLSSTGRPSALAVDSSGDVFVKDEGVAGVRELEPNGTIKVTQFDEGSTSVTALAVDGSGDLYVGDSSGGFHVLKYDSSGKELAGFASNTVAGGNRGMAFSNTTGELYAAESSGSVWVLTPPPPGPLIDSESATPELRGAATLEAQVNPEGNETTVHFEYVDEAHFKASGFASATSTTPVSIGATPTFSDQPVSVDLARGTLVPGVIYHYRLVARDSLGQTSAGDDQSFQEIPPALILGPWAADAAGTSVTFGAKIDPLGANTTYRLEYGTSTSYEHVFTGSVGEGTSYVAITRHVQELQPVTTYHFRIVTSNEVGTWLSADHTFTTQVVGGELALPDGRVWELVSPANKHGALIEPELTGLLGELQAASDGSGITYLANEPITEKPPASYGPAGDQVVSVRGSGGWRSQEVGVAGKLSEDGVSVPNLSWPPVAAAFSDDLSRALVEPNWRQTQPLSPEATERTLYLHDNTTDAYLPLVTPANVPPGAKIGGDLEEGVPVEVQQMVYLAATPDLSHVVFSSPQRLTPEAVQGTGACTGVNLSCPENLYEWSAGRLALVDILPDGEPLHGESLNGAYLGRTSLDVMHALSNDGRRVVWAHGPLRSSTDSIALYVRDMVEKRTLQIGGPRARFETMSGDGSTVFYWENSELYAFNFNAGTTTDLTASHGSTEHHGGVKDGFIMVASEDGSYVYYVATGVLAPGAISGEDNLYVSHDSAGGWTTSLVATLSKADEFAAESQGAWEIWRFMVARVSPNGRYLAFMSSRPLTGYDNRDALSEQPDEEVYLYDAAASGRLVCASCNPTGARPIGLFEENTGISTRPLVDRQGLWEGHSIAANIPGMRQGNGNSVYSEAAPTQPRYLSDSGRLFFNSSDALVAQDINGLVDVYQYEPSGVGSCASASVTFSGRSGGCVDLISAGTSSAESGFMDASENGGDVFFATASKLVAEDYDTSTDVYDAHVCTTAVPCKAAPVSPPPCTSGDSCKAAPSSQPEIFGPAPSATFSGAGNVVAEAKKRVVKHKRKPGHRRRARHKRRKGGRARGSATGKAIRRGK